jgi:hypothetical protein
MHIEILVEDRSGKLLLESLVPRIIGEHGQPHTWRLIPYRGIGSIPKELKDVPDPSRRVLLNRLPALLQGYGKTPGIDAVVVVVDNDRRDCRDFLRELQGVHERCSPRPLTLFRLALEEIEAWYLGDMEAVRAAYPNLKGRALEGYAQDACVGTWELLAEAVYPGGSTKLRTTGYAQTGALKCEWAQQIGPLMNIEENLSPSFQKFRDGMRRLVGAT